MTGSGIECPKCGRIAPPGSYFCPHDRTFLRFGGNQTVVVPKVTAPPEAGQGQGHDTLRQEARPRGRVSVAVREADGEYAIGRVLACRVAPGEELRLIARVHNQTQVVDNFDLRVEGVPKEDGLPEEWWSIKPETIYLHPRDSGHRGEYETEVEVRFTPPRSSEATAGTRALRIVADSRAARAPAAHADLELEITPYAELSAELTTPKLRSRSKARTELRVHNTGNDVADVAVTAGDETGKLRFKLRPERLTVGARDKAAARVDVKAPKRTWIGQPKTHPFTVSAQAATSSTPVVADGALDQRP